MSGQKRVADLPGLNGEALSVGTSELTTGTVPGATADDGKARTPPDGGALLGANALESQAFGGYHLWVRLPQDVYAGIFAPAALGNGVAMTPGGDNYSLTTVQSSHARMSYVAATSTAYVLEGVERIARTLPPCV